MTALPPPLHLAAPGGDDGSVDYTRDVRPIIAGRCLECHGPSATSRKGGSKARGGLRLDTRDGALTDHDGVRAIVPGKPDASELLRRISSSDPDERMPPREKGKPLTPEEIAVLRRWIADGAPYEKHWSFTAPVRPAVPAVKHAAWPKNDIDRFILARLEKEGRTASPEADRTALLRRVSLDLTGLPPTVEEVDRFVADPDPRAYEKRVDRLLASKAFGERWARVWLDLARYADSQGYAEDKPRMIWGYRDWVIRAINENMPFDRFSIEQIAGDLLPDATDRQRIATAFHRNTLTNTEGGTDDEEFRNMAIVDRVNTTMQVWMAITIACTQCHDHKYDPFSQKEFYRLFAFFNSTEDSDKGNDAPRLELYSKEQQKRRAALAEEIAKLEETLAHPGPEIVAGQKRWEEQAGRTIAWTDVGDRSFPAGPVGVTGIRLEPGVKKLSVRLVPDTREAVPARYVRVELPGKGKMLSLAEVQVFSDGKNIAPEGRAKQSSTGFNGPAKLAIDGNTDGDFNKAKSTTHTNPSRDPWWELDLGGPRPVARVVVWNRTDGGAGISNRIKGYRVVLLDGKRKAVARQKGRKIPLPSEEIAFDGERELAGRLLDGGTTFLPDRPVAGSGRVILAFAGNAKVRLTRDPGAKDVLATPAAIRERLAKKDPSDADRREIAKYYRSIAPELEPVRKELAARKKERDGMKPAVSVPVMKELPRKRRRRTHIQIRGSFLNKGEEVHRGIPAVLHPFPQDAPVDRLGLARWLVSPENPLTARVTVNRFWEQVFGQGLVLTSEDFGVRGELPSHPGLMDWLATEFVRTGWDVKKLLRLMVTSATYRQSSRLTPDLLACDPFNRLLTRGPRFRISAEMVRDQALFVSGLLSRKMYGPSVKPPQPKLGLKAAFSTSTDWENSRGEDRYRRGIYTFWRRSSPYPSMATFDAPSREVCTVKRQPTNTPLQALVTLNDPVYIEAAQALGRRMVAEGGPTVASRITRGFRLCLARPPSDAERARLVALHASALERYRKAPDAARKMATDPIGPPPEGGDVADLAAWTVVGNVLLNLDEMFLKR